MTSVYIISVLRVAITAGVLFGFPALAVSAWKRGGAQRLALAVLAAGAVVVAFSLMTASPTFGNVREPTVGFARTAFGTTLLFGMSFGLPIITSTAAVILLGRDRLPFWAVYAASVGAATCGWIAGMIGAIWIVPMFS